MPQKPIVKTSVEINMIKLVITLKCERLERDRRSDKTSPRLHI